MIDEAKILETLKFSGLDHELTGADFNKPFRMIGIDSLDLFNFLTELEEAFGIHIQDSDVEEFRNLNDVKNFLNHSVKKPTE